MLGIDDCNEAGISGVSEGVVGGVCQQLRGVPGGCKANSVRAKPEQTTSKLLGEKQSSGSKVT